MLNGMLLAAGHGSRMEPLSTFIAKTALDVLGRPLLSSALDHLRAAGCERVAANLHRHPDQVAEALLAATRDGPDVLLSREATLLGGAGGVAAARPLLGDGPVLVANADVWASLDLAPLVHAVAEDVVVLALLPQPDPARWSSVLLEDDGRIAEIVPPGGVLRGEPFLYTGFQLLGGATVAALPDPPSEWRPVWLAARDRGVFRGVVVTGGWREAGTPASYRELVLAALADTTWVHPDATVAGGARAVRCAIAAGCRVADAARVADSVVIAGGRIGSGATVSRCIVAAGAAVGAGEIVEDRLVLPDCRAPFA